MNRAKVITALIALLAALGLGGYTIVKKTDLLRSSADVVQKDIYRVMQVLDGDTMRVDIGKEQRANSKEEKTERVRLLGLDAPEEGECYAKEAGEYLRSLVGDKDVRLEKDVSGADQYGRLLRYVFIPSGDEKENDVFVNEMLVREGYAVYDAHPPDHRYREFLASAGEEARKEKRGLWGVCDVPMSESEKANQNDREIDMPPPSPNCIIKGNISEKGYGKTYLVRGCDNYNNVKVDTRKGERYFCTEEEATAAGFRRADNCPQ